MFKKITKTDKKKKKISVGKVWGLTTLLVFSFGYVYIVFWLQLSFWWMFLFYFFYIAVSILIFRKTLYGELGFFLHSFGKTEKGLNVCQKACQNETRSIRALTLYGLHLLREGKAKQASELFVKGLAINDRRNLLYDKYLVANLASCQWIDGEIDQAIDTLKDLEHRYGYINPDVNTTLGYLYLTKGDYEKALSYTNTALEGNSEHGPALDNLGQIYYRQSDYEKAEEFFKKALAHKPTMADSKYYLGLINEKRSDTDSAKQYFKDAYESTVTALNTVTRQQIDEKYAEYFN